MRIVNLVDDTRGVPECIPQHGLSFYIETEHHHLLFDTGASEITWENARRLGVDLSTVDTVIISHGHYDHAGGVQSFTDLNPNAKIYIQSAATGEYFRKKAGNAGYKYIGIDAGIPTLPQVEMISGDLVIDDELSLFTGVKGNQFKPDTGSVLKERKNGRYVADAFRHEQHLVIREGDELTLFCGCAHTGILNILDSFLKKYGTAPKTVIGGMHLNQPDPFTPEQEESLREMAEQLSGTGCVFYTGHCTGEPAFRILKSVLGTQIQYVRCGQMVPADTEEDFLEQRRPAPVNVPETPSKPAVKKGKKTYMKMHRLFAWGTVVCFVMTMVTGYLKK